MCGAPATWQKKPIERTRQVWTYCEHHKPEGAERIPSDAKYVVTRLELHVAIASPPGNLQEAAVEAGLAAIHAIESVGGVVTKISVLGGKASGAGSGASPGRLELAGEPTPTTANAAPSEALGAPARPFHYRRRRTG